MIFCKEAGMLIGGNVAIMATAIGGWQSHPEVPNALLVRGETAQIAVINRSEGPVQVDVKGDAGPSTLYPEGDEIFTVPALPGMVKFSGPTGDEYLFVIRQ